MSKDTSRAPRRQIYIKAHLLLGFEWVEVSLANVSSTGLMVKFPGGFTVGKEVQLRRRGMTILGQVVWSTQTRFGVRSFEEIDLSALLEAGLQPRVTDISKPKKNILWHWRIKD